MWGRAFKVMRRKPVPLLVRGESSDPSLRAQQCGIVDVGMVHVSGGVVWSRAAAAKLHKFDSPDICLSNPP